MSTPDITLQISSQFDAQLITLGEWSLDDRRLLNHWLEQAYAESKGRVAADVIASYVTNCLKNDISMEGRTRIKRLRNAASLLEQLVFTTRELDEKFYRDHINHMLKVALLAKAIARKKPFCLSESELTTLVLACVFHDVAYPLSECGRIFNKTLESLKDCFSTAELFTNELMKEAKVDFQSLALLTGENETRLKTALREMNHGLLSAIEFKVFLKDNKSIEIYSDVIRAIALHDSDFKTPIDVIDDPIVGLLIMSDELQDWGRPTDQDMVVIPRIENFELMDGHLRGEFIAKEYGNFSLLKQICSKMNNLSRLRVDSNRLEFDFRYNLKGFEKIDHNNFQHVLQILFNSVDKALMNPANNIDLSESAYFEKSFFGLEITMPVKEALYRKLKIGSKKSIFANMNIYLNEDLSEMILTDKVLGEIEAIVLSNENDSKISAKIVEGKRIINGNIYSGTSPETMEFSRFIAAEIRFINYLIHEIGGSKVEGIPSFPKLEGLAEPVVLKHVRDQLGNDFSPVYEKLKLRSVINCLKNRACFLFK